MIDFRLYLITDRKLFYDNASMMSTIEEALKGGVRAIQLREKDLSIRELLEMAYKLRDATKKYKAEFYINDRVDIALAVGADGVHLGHSGIPADAARKASAGRLKIGVSAHSIEEAKKAEADSADFITLGPVYETPSKFLYGKPLGIDRFKQINQKILVPVFAIGGINIERAQEVMAAGAFGFAMISGILASEHVRETSEKFMRICNDKN